ncbi:MAG: hypothetical protein JNN15_04210 [Blastocatellia bacterium]|nr:hypothetical protein [Blastocatellia bacterium]
MSNRGECLLCHSKFEKSSITNHLKSCSKKKLAESSKKREKTYHIVVEGKYYPQYWMHIEVPIDARLSLLDQFLRKTWLECCSHMSEFVIDGEPFDDMSQPLKNCIEPKETFEYIYDFGTSTELKLKVIEEQEGEKTSRESIKLLARNEPPDISCDFCNDFAEYVCVECTLDGGCLCKKCVNNHECDEEMLLPIVNSPRVGECDYRG